MSLRTTEPGGSVLHLPTPHPTTEFSQWLKVRGKGLNTATCHARKLSILLVLTSIAHLLGRGTSCPGLAPGEGV